MSAPQAQVVAAIMTLNRPEVPFSWSPSPEGVIGTWNYADAQWAGLLSAASVDASYRLIVALHEDATFTFTDHTEESSVDVNSNGLSFSKTTFKGSIKKKSFNKTFAPVAVDHGEVGHATGWNFDSELPKNAVRDVLTHHGWTERKLGFWARMTGASS
ncbi:hypothetical protein [Humidisolicoccus flavus]|uniref:hypothetical protein n=1 Tax=Humidisolicoccus flavus TaxID=3111414 RepID=UPI003244E55B